MLHLSGSSITAHLRVLCARDTPDTRTPTLATGLLAFGTTDALLVLSGDGFVAFDSTLGWLAGSAAWCKECSSRMFPWGHRQRRCNSAWRRTLAATFELWCFFDILCVCVPLLVVGRFAHHSRASRRQFGRITSALFSVMARASIAYVRPTSTASGP